MDSYDSFLNSLSDISLNAITVETVCVGFLLVILFFLSGMASGSEVAYFALTPNEVEQLRDSDKAGDKTVLHLLDEPKRLLATILIANNFVNVSIVMLSAVFTTEIVNFGQARILQFVFETLIITTVILFIGEILPKIFAQQHRLAFSRFMAYPLEIAVRIFSPFSRLLMSSTNVVNSKLSKHQKTMSQDDLEQALDLTSEAMSDEKEMLEGIVKFMDLEVCDIMTPRVDVVGVGYDVEFSKVLQIVVDSGYSRLPVFGETPDDVRGLIYVKDIIKDLGQDRTHNWHPNIRKTFFIPETKKVNDLLTEFQSTKTHMAIIVDEYGCMQGIVTLEDIIEEIVGDINDEQDDDDPKDWYRQPDGSFVFEAKISLNDMCKVLDINVDVFNKMRGDAETLAGLLLEKTGIIPQKRDIVEIGTYKFEILSADQRRINKVKLVVRPEVKK